MGIESIQKKEENLGVGIGSPFVLGFGSSAQLSVFIAAVLAGKNREGFDIISRSSSPNNWSVELSSAGSDILIVV